MTPNQILLYGTWAAQQLSCQSLHLKESEKWDCSIKRQAQCSILKYTTPSLLICESPLQKQNAGSTLSALFTVEQSNNPWSQFWIGTTYSGRLWISYLAAYWAVPQPDGSWTCRCAVLCCLWWYELESCMHE